MKPRFVSKPVDVGHGFTVEFSFRPGGLFCEWSPDVPNEHDMARVLARYTVARDHFIAARFTRTVGKVGGVTTEVVEP